MLPLPNIIISRTDSIGDVILTLPVAGALKKQFPNIKIAFLGKRYTQPVIACCEHVDVFIDVDDFLHQEVSILGAAPAAILHVFPVRAIAQRAMSLKIPIRIGTTHRLYHWLTCNKWVSLSRKNSDQHEAQLNLALLKPITASPIEPLEQISGLLGFNKWEPLDERYKQYLHPHKYNLILHPKSQGSAREWGIGNFIALIKLLDKDRFHIMISGTEKERESLIPLLNECANDVTDITGKMNLPQFISFIAHCDGLVANSTGPLHIAAAVGINSLGIFPPIRPMHPGRWAPLGTHASVLVVHKNCSDCRKNATSCHCIQEISPIEVATRLQQNPRLQTQ